MSSNKNSKDDKTEIIKQNFFQEKSKFEILEDKFKKTVFGVLNILLKFEDDSFEGEVISLLNETCQYLYYPFYDPMGYLWKKEVLFHNISKFLSYFQTVVFFNNTELFITVFYIGIFAVLGVVVDIFYVAYIISSNNKSGAVWPMRLLRSVVSYIVTVLFNPMVEYFLAILECSDKDESGNYLGYYQNYNVDDMHCYTNIHFTIMCVEAVFIVVVFVTICTVVQTVFYEQKTAADKDGAKTNSKCDLLVLFVKIVLIFIYSFLVWDKDKHWIVVPGTFIACLLQFIVYWVERPFYEERMNTAFFIHTGLVLYSTVVMFFLKILENAPFDGGIFILFIGMPMISYILITQKDTRFTLLLTNINKFDKGESIFKQIRYFLELCDKKYTDRKSNILLRGYIHVHEEHCTNKNCPLKKYLKEIDRKPESKNANTDIQNTNAGNETNVHQTTNVMNTVNQATTIINANNTTNTQNNNNEHNETDLYLYEYAMEMYQNGISKFPSCTTLRINYSFFLMERMNNTKKALIELKNCEKYNPSFEEEFIIFRFCENGGADENGDDDDDEDGLDIVSAIAYKNHFAMFKEGLTEITSIYSEFWQLLLNNNQKSEEDLTKMNEFGEKINRLVEDIKGHFAEMEKLRYNDEEVLSLYAEFYQEILNDKINADYYNSRLNDCQGGDDEVNNNNDLNEIPTGDDFDYIFLSSEGTNIGKIIKLSMGVCEMFGYTPSDLLGKNINYLIPDFCTELHTQVLINKLNKFKTQMTQNFRNGVKTSNKNNFKEIFVFGKNKLKHAIPLSMKVCIMYTQDQSDLFFAAKITNEEMYDEFNKKNPTPGIPPIINFNMKICFVLTDLNFIVQYYTANAINFLGFKSNTSGNIDITKSINDINNNEEKTDSGNKVSKNEIFKKKYLEPKIIIWKTLLSQEEEAILKLDPQDKFGMRGLLNYTKKLNQGKSTNNTTTIIKEENIYKKHSSFNKNFLPLRRQKFKEDYFLLTVSEIALLSTCVGYVFRFEVVDMEDNDLDGFDDKNLMPLTSLTKRISSEVDVNPDYIPDVTKKFDLNTHKLGFQSQDFHNFSVINEVEEDNQSDINSIKKPPLKNWHKKLKDFAYQKINKFKAQFFDEEEEEENDEESEEFSSSSDEQNSSQSHKTSSKSSEKPKAKKNPNTNSVKRASIRNSLNYFKRMSMVGKIENSYEFNYYQVKCLNEIRFSIYDFKKRRLIEVPKIKRESQVEYKKKENIPNFIQKKKKPKREFIEYEEPEETDTVQVKQIEYALRKEQFQPEIVKLKYVSLGLYLSITILAAILFSIFIKDDKILKENLLIIKNSHDLLQNCINGLYLIRELVLLNNEKYSFYLFEKHYMYLNITERLNEIFIESYELQQNILTTSLKTSENRNNYFLKGTINLNNLEEDLTVKTFELSINSAVTLLFNTLYKIKTTQLDLLIPTNPDVYFYVTNLENPILNILEENFNIFLEELFDNVHNFKYTHYVILLLIGIILVLFLILIKLIYDKITKRKSSYLEVFFDIDDFVCKRALDKCEAFSKQLHPLQQGETTNDDDENSNGKKKMFLQKISKNKKNNQNNKKETILNFHFLLFLISFVLIILIYFTSNVLILHLAYSQIQNYVNMYNITSYKQRRYCLLFDNLREYFFDFNTYTGEKFLKEIVESQFTNIYYVENSLSEEFIISELPKSFKKLYQNISLFNICRFTKDLFFNENHGNYLVENGETCNSTTGNSSFFGFNVLQSYYLQLLRINKNYFEVLIKISKKYNFNYNNTLYKTNFEIQPPENQENLYLEKDYFKIFNEKTTFELSIMRFYFIEPIFDYLMTNFYNSINSFWKGKHSLYMILMILFFIFFTAFFGFYWLPFIYKQDEDIYKTKNMLSIIPKDVLASLKNISKLLNVGNLSVVNNVENEFSEEVCRLIKR